MGITRYVPMENTYVLKEEFFWKGSIKEHFKKQLVKLQIEFISKGLLILPIKIEMDNKFCYRQYFHILDIHEYDIENPISKIYDNYERVWYKLPDPNFILRIKVKKVWS